MVKLNQNKPKKRKACTYWEVFFWKENHRFVSQTQDNSKVLATLEMFLLNWRLFEEKEEWLWRVLTFEHIFFWQKNCSYKISSHHTRIVDRCNNKTKCFKNAFCIFLISLVFKVFLQSIFSIHNLSNSFRRLQKHMWCNIVAI